MELTLQSSFLATSGQTPRELLAKRLNLLRSDIEHSPEEVVKCFRSMCLVTSRYTIRCAEIDLWYIQSQNVIAYRTDPRQRVADVCDPYRTLWFRVIVQALVDIRSGRPCDLGAWWGDMPPGNLRCQPSDHICADNANNFLANLSPGWMHFAGLSPETVELYARKRKRR